ncbi:MAG: glycosyltransferase family 2 protein [Lachnospiraceae bacterium]
MKVLVIIPAFNEQECIEKTVENLKQEAPFADYIVVNDCSNDKTREILQKNHFSYIDLKLNLGIGGAVQSGYRYAQNHGYDIAIQMDGDGQHDPAYLKSLIAPIEKGEADITIGSRFIEKEGFQSSGMRRMGIRILNAIIFLCTGNKVTDCTSGFRAVNAKYIKMYAADYPIDYPEPEAIVYSLLQGAGIREVPVVMRQRAGGKSSIRPFHSFYYMFKVSLAMFLCKMRGSGYYTKRKDNFNT